MKVYKLTAQLNTTCNTSSIYTWGKCLLFVQTDAIKPLLNYCSYVGFSYTVKHIYTYVSMYGKNSLIWLQGPHVSVFITS